MNKLIELSGSLRAAAIMSAAHEVIGDGLAVTPATLKARLPDARFPNFGDVGEDEAQAAFEAIEQEAEQHAASLEAEQPAEPEAEPQAEPQPEAPTLAPTEAVENLRLAHVALAEARAAVQTKTNRRNAARELLSAAVMAWQTGLPRVTRDQAVKEAIASFQAEKAERVQTMTCGPSVIDRQAFFGKGGTANDFARKQMRTGYRRGALPASMRGLLPVNLGGESRLQHKLEPER